MRQAPPPIAYLLPNLFTAASIFTGFYAIALALEGSFESAAWFIFLALIFDGLDGRVARMTNTASHFGVEFDSLADIVAFGVAPALLLYLYIGESYGRIGIMVSALFIIFGAVRLARFNVTTSRIEPSVFIGLPIPTAAIMISIAILVIERYEEFAPYKVFILPLALVLAILMVSNIRYPSFKKMNFKTFHFIRFLIGLIVVAMGVFIYPIEGMALLAAGYLLYGPLRASFYMLRRLIYRG
ncbi:MAG: CDP-diacylglycerol--serine O-phosphatidyltransferase [Sulfuricurvum sp. GWF2_44_89]|uniref:CDP-diacylglycerol--serine O-phosphatidyltransferase n=1 Tax=Sulfuricurvum kujiense TaxID=148813 RepID=A0A2D3WIV1_9BACT|nr:MULTISPECIES: CDP-diacylglycerol--serine O-phosphatidyltransferase [Sulfuricurvum]OHD78563.1 MAG: CDP-diacylglycerol--serine O-phosphatidyltransferase [Sulfuricurvum sp. GWF2_44_89]OHD92542.1 MAG: CDP-diacylglycerol--serine O-phosphatidyltransferase [Sulfuricurvum sp. RIFOXYD12_FULL_44_77]OHD93269.1 MAG: CDP-diacylglycerol--serine O-phosphatidyltransferase [Sulfuricurvum sp. RIFOXYD2_FULL_44_160]DAB38677.1 MAG TPA: CDP-diacylglycerol--serine O-phosphatidyltransferase [Sulfuricurvum kujiense]